ncbi:MAG: replication-associated recombination protein A [Candidatus Zixiibacteriota bacterium]|nr:MAG: replication-associated recombination protein A [candidate division Zixibacteria bacterium]
MDFFESNKSNSGQELVAPLADRMRPASFDEFVGQQKVIGEKTPLRKAIESDRVPSIILWGPPGTGKTTLAQLIAHHTKGQYVPFSAVSSSIKEIKVLISKSRDYFNMSGKRTYVFIDEIHRFNKAQQDAFLPYVERGDIVLIGATTENPSFEVNSALLSRMKVYVLTRLSADDIRTVLERALSDDENGIADMQLSVEPEVLGFVAEAADGDARRGLSLLEAVASYVGQGGKVNVDLVRDVHQKGALVYDKAGEEHYNLISALHKTIRGGDPDAALYWLSRMLESGEEPLYIVRRLIRFASEDIGLADPFALTMAISARDTYHFLGSPEGELAIAQLVIYLACAPKSNSAYVAFARARADAAERGSLPVPLWLRNAPTSLMKGLDYGKGYKYAHDFDNALADQENFPDELKGRQYYEPKSVGREAKIAEYLYKYREFRRKAVAQRKEVNRPTGAADTDK